MIFFDFFVGLGRTVTRWTVSAINAPLAGLRIAADRARDAENATLHRFFTSLAESWQTYMQNNVVSFVQPPLEFLRDVVVTRLPFLRVFLVRNASPAAALNQLPAAPSPNHVVEQIDHSIYIQLHLAGNTPVGIENAWVRIPPRHTSTDHQAFTLRVRNDYYFAQIPPAQGANGGAPMASITLVEPTWRKKSILSLFSKKEDSFTCLVAPRLEADHMYRPLGDSLGAGSMLPLSCFILVGVGWLSSKKLLMVLNLETVRVSRSELSKVFDLGLFSIG